MPDPLLKDKKIKIILDSAVNLFAQKGYHDVTMEEIAEKVGVAKGTLYLYFSSKDELYWGILERGLHELFAGLEQEAQRLIPPEEKLRAILALILRHSRENFQFYRLILREETNFSRSCMELLAPWREKAFQLFEQVLKEGITRGNFRPMDTSLLSVLLPGMIRSVVFFYEGPKEEKDIIKEITDCIFWGISHSPKDS